MALAIGGNHLSSIVIPVSSAEWDTVVWNLLRGKGRSSRDAFYLSRRCKLGE